MSKVLIIGATGTVGGLVLDEALRRALDVRALVRDKERASGLSDAVELVQGDLGDRDSVRAAAMQAIPAYAGKLRLAGALSESDTRPAMVSITNFNQNDEVFREDILSGTFPTPLHADGVNRVDVRDAAEVITTALADPDFPAGFYKVVGPESRNGEQSARTWSEELGRPVRYTGDDPNWREALAARLSGQKLEDWIHSFELLGTAPIPTDPAEAEATTRLLGHPPRSFRDYVRDAVTRWRHEAVAKTPDCPTDPCSSAAVVDSFSGRGGFPLRRRHDAEGWPA